MVWIEYSRFSGDVTAAMFVPLNKEKAAMFVSQPTLRELNCTIVQMFSFVLVKKTWLLVT